MHVRLGDSVVALNGPWKFQIGDSPIDSATNIPVWAQPSFDDSKWETVDLTPASGSFDPISGTSGYVPGWTAKGHHGYWGYAWYRIRIQLETRQDAKLALAGPADVDDAFQIFDNGEMVGTFGDFSSKLPSIYFSQPMMFPLAPSKDNASKATQLLAYRVWMEPSTLTQSDDVGGIHTAPLLGEIAAVAAQHQMRWVEMLRAYAGSVIGGLVFALLGVVALSLMLFDRVRTFFSLSFRSRLFMPLKLSLSF
jgi:hypothetical protein